MYKSNLIELLSWHFNQAEMYNGIMCRGWQPCHIILAKMIYFFSSNTYPLSGEVDNYGKETCSRTINAKNMQDHSWNYHEEKDQNRTTNILWILSKNKTNTKAIFLILNIFTQLVSTKNNKPTFLMFNIKAIHQLTWTWWFCTNKWLWDIYVQVRTK